MSSADHEEIADLPEDLETTKCPRCKHPAGRHAWNRPHPCLVDNGSSDECKCSAYGHRHIIGVTYD